MTKLLNVSVLPPLVAPELVLLSEVEGRKKKRMSSSLEYSLCLQVFLSAVVEIYGFDKENIFMWVGLH